MILHLFTVCIGSILSIQRLLGHSQAERKVLLISLDGFRHDYFEFAERSNVSLPAFSRIFKQGVRADKMNNVFISRTFPNHITLITGCYEETHGNVDNQYFDVTFNETVSFLNTSQMIQAKYFNGIEPIWMTNMRNGFDSAIIFWPGQLYAYGGKFRPAYTLGRYTAELSFEYKVNTMLDWMHRPHTTLGLLYHNQPDRTGHLYGPNSPEILATLRKLDESIAYLLSRIDSFGLTNVLNVLIVSDHGMSAISADRRVFLDRHVDRRLYELQQQSYALWGLKPVGNVSVDLLMQQLYNVDHTTAYRRTDIPTKWRYGGSRNVAPIIVLADAGWAIVHNDSERFVDYGAHGYDANLSDMKGIFVAWGPNIVKTKNHSGFDMNSVDVFPFISKILRLKHLPPINGSVTSINWLLKSEDDSGFLGTLTTICVVALLSALFVCIIISCAHYHVQTCNVQKIGHTYALKSGSLVRDYRSSKKRPSNPLKTSSDNAFLLASNSDDEDDVFMNIKSTPLKLTS